MDITTTAQPTEKHPSGRFAQMQNRMRSSIRVRFGFSFSLIVLLFLISAAVSWVSYTTLNAGGDTAILQQTAVAQLSVNAQSNLLTARSNEHNYQTNAGILTNEQARAQYLTPFISNVSQIRQRGIELKLLLEQSGGTAAEITSVDDLMTAVDQYEANFLTLIEALEANPAADITMQQTAMDTAAQTISETLNTLGETSAARASTTWNRTQLLSQLSATSTILMLLTSIVVTVYLGFRLTFGVARPIRQLKMATDHFINEQVFEPTSIPHQTDDLHYLIKHVNTVFGRDAERAAATQQLQEQVQAGITSLEQAITNTAQGDFSAKASTQNELTHDIARAFNQLTAHLQTIKTSMRQSAAQLDKATHALHTTSSGLAEKSVAQVTHLQQHSATMNSFSNQAKMAVQALYGSKTVGKEIQQTLLGSNDTAQKTQASMERLRQQVQDTAKRVKRLGESSQEISEIGDMLSTIANQISLLALNASIKTKGGPGDATQLTQEIEKIAEQTNASAATIGTLIETIQRETAQVITAVETTTAEVVHSSKLTRHMEQQLAQLNTQTDTLTRSLKAHFHDSQQQAKETIQLTAQLAQISQLVEKNHGRTQKLTTAINGMKQLTRSLSDTATKFGASNNKSKKK